VDEELKNVWESDRTLDLNSPFPGMCRGIKMKKWLFLALITLPLAGCGTLSTLDQSKPYSGIQQDMELMEPCKNVGCAGLVILTPLAIIDFPFSFVGDTLMLPIKGIQNLVQD
jgi:uncharacterized protein YceK